MGAIDELMELEFGRPVTFEENPLITQLETTTTEILRPNADRLGFLIVNLDADEAYIAPGDVAASSTRGIRLAPSGGWRFFTYKEDGVLPSLRWNGLTAGAAAGAIYYVEYRAL